MKGECRGSETDTDYSTSVARKSDGKTGSEGGDRARPILGISTTESQRGARDQQC